jgi:putative membrane protein
LIFQLVALVESRFPARPVTQTRTYWLLPCLFWLSTTAQVFNNPIHPTDGFVSAAARPLRSPTYTNHARQQRYSPSSSRGSRP